MLIWAPSQFCTVYTPTYHFDTPAQQRQQRIRPVSIYNEITAENDLGHPDGVDAFARNECFTACSRKYTHASADGHAILHMSSSPLRSLSAPPDPNHLTKDGFCVSGTLGTPLWCDRAESRSLSQPPLYGTNVTLFSSDANHETCSAVPIRVEYANASHVEAGESVTADTPNIVSSSDRETLGYNSFDGDDAAGLQEDDDILERGRTQWPVPALKTGDYRRSGSAVPCRSSPYAVILSDSGVQVDGGNDMPKSSKTDCSISPKQENGDDFPLLPKAQGPPVFTNREPPNATRYAINSTKPGMTWAERFKVTIASPSKKKLPETPTDLRNEDSVPGSSGNPTREPGEQLVSMEVSDHTKLQQLSISSPRTTEPVRPRRALLPIEWQVVAPNTSPVTTLKSDNSSSNAQSSTTRSSEHLMRAYSTISKSRGGASRTDIGINKRSQATTASSEKAPSAPDDRTPTNKPSTPINTTERLVETSQHGKHLRSACSRSTISPRVLSATSASFTPRAPITAQVDLPKKPSYAEVASLRLPALPCTPTTPSSGSGAFFSASQSPEHTTDSVHGVLLGAMAKLNFELAAGAEHGPTTVLETEGRITEKDAAGFPFRIVQEHSSRGNQKPLSRCNSDQQGKKRSKKKRGYKSRNKGTSPATPRSVGSLPGQLCSLTSSDRNSIASTWACKETNSAPLTPQAFEGSKIDGHEVRSRIGIGLPLTPGMTHRVSQMYTGVPEVTPYSKITIAVAAEHVGWYCPACYFKQQWG